MDALLVPFHNRLCVLVELNMRKFDKVAVPLGGLAAVSIHDKQQRRKYTALWRTCVMDMDI